MKAQDFSSLSRSTTVPSIRKGDVEEVVVLLPPSAEQTRIAQKLDKLLAQVDTLKNRIDAIPALLNHFRQSVLAAAVSGRLTSASENLTLPASWKMVPLSVVLQDLRYGTAQKCDYNGGGVGVLRIPNIGDREITLNDLKSSEFSEAEINKLSLQEGDILIIRSNGSVDLVGKSVVIGHKEAGLLFAGYLIRLRLDRHQALPAYVNFWLKSPRVRQVIEQTARSTSGVNNINSEEIKSLEFTMPPLDEQTEIVRRVEQLFAFADQLENKVQTAQARIDLLTQSLLAKAFRGELVPQDPDDEPASVLLERIRAQRAAQPKARRGRKAAAAN
ncbi:restriction endonuclease subunit S [Pseudomonas lalucatii]|nr:restriction endonuclease subunit S [Pseudomonas lalucatii]